MAISDATVFVAADSLYAVNWEGSIRWKSAPIKANTMPVVPPDVVFPKLVVVGTTDGWIYLFRVSDGKLIKSYPVGGAVAWSLSVSQGIAYLGSQDTKLYAVDVYTGTVLWSYTTPAAIDFPAVVGGTAVLVANMGGSLSRLTCLDAVWGTFRWQTADDVFGVAADATTAYGADVGAGGLFARSILDGSLKWQLPEANWFWQPVLEGSILYASTSSQVRRSVYAINASDGSIRWRTSISGDPTPTPPAVLVDPSPGGINLVFVATEGGVGGNHLVAINANDGTISWKSSVTIGGPGESATTPVVAVGNHAPRHVYVGSENGSLYAFDYTSGALVWQLPLGIVDTDATPVFWVTG
jgi:outer membrane protein assembly factor BamB